MGNQDDGNSSCCWCQWIFIIIALIIASGAAVIAILFLEQNGWKFVSFQILEPKERFSPFSDKKSCESWRNLGYTESGVYSISPDSNLPAILTYCDMESSGGGWTLVASVNENDILGNCITGDKWSGETGLYRGTSLNSNSNSWMSYNVFGDLESITLEDYKNVAYYGLQASNVMIWQVQNNVKLNDINDEAFLKYHTNDQFLDRAGSNLQTFYAQYATLIYVLTSDTAVEIAFSLNSVIESLIVGWDNYFYDGDAFHIEDGGNDLYDDGNMVSFRINNGSYTEMEYNLEYKSDSLDYTLNSRTTHPFMTLAWLENSFNQLDDFSLRVTSNTGADSDGYIINLEGNFTSLDVSVTWRLLQVVGSGDPILCEIFFTMTSPAWNSLTPNITYPRWSTDQGNLDEEIKLENISNMFVGYLLLSRTQSSQNITREEAVSVLQFIVSIASQIERESVQRFVSSVTFVKGNSRDVLSRVPISYRNQVEAGYIEFRAFDQINFPYALCPGLRIINDTAASANCVGTLNSNYAHCNDFAGWSGGRVPSESVTEYSRSASDIDSTVLIFIR